MARRIALVTACLLCAPIGCKKAAPGEPGQEARLAAHQHDASDVTSGVFSLERIPGMDLAHVPHGPGSGLDADTLDGLDSTAFALANDPRFSRTDGINNVQELGAKGDGMADDTAAIQAALDRPGPTYFPTGSYRVTATLRVTQASKRVFGVGRGSLLIKDGPGAILDISPPPPVASLSQWLGGVSVSHLAFDGVSNASSNQGLKLSAVLSSSFDHIWAKNLDRVVELVAVDRSIFESFYSYDNNPNTGNPNYWFYADGTAGASRCGDNTFTKMEIIANVSHFFLKGTAASSMDGINISDVIMFSRWNAPARKENVHIEHGYWVAIANNKLFETGTDALYLFNCDHVTVTGNVVAWPGQTGLGSGFVVDGDGTAGYNMNVAISNNFIDQPSNHGIRLQGTTNFSVSGNVVRQPCATVRFNGGQEGKCDGVSLAGASNGRVSGTVLSGQTHRADVALDAGTRGVVVEHAYGGHVLDLGTGNLIIDGSQPIATAVVPGATTTNLLPFSEQMDRWVRSGWTVAPPTVSADAAPDPTGALAAERVDFAATTTIADSNLQQSGSLAVGPADVFTASVWLRADNPAILLLQLFSVNDNTTKIDRVAVGSQWRRYSVTNSGMTAANTVWFRLSSPKSSPASTVYAWGAQLERGGQVSPYIKTGALPVTAAASPGRVLFGAASWAPPSLVDGAATSISVPVPGALPGDTVAVGFSVSVPAGALLAGSVSANDTVAVTLLNKTGAPLSLAPGTVKVDVFQH